MDTVGIVDPESLINQYYPRILRTAYLLSQDRLEAEDLAQETALQAMKGWTRFEGRSDPATWLYSIAFNLYGKHLRSRHRQQARRSQWVERNGHKFTSETADDAALRRELHSSLWNKVAQLPDHQKHAVVLRYAEDFSLKQIAEILDCPAGTVKSRLHHALQQLRDEMTNEYPVDDCGDDRSPESRVRGECI